MLRNNLQQIGKNGDLSLGVGVFFFHINTMYMGLTKHLSKISDLCQLDGKAFYVIAFSVVYLVEHAHFQNCGGKLEQETLFVFLFSISSFVRLRISTEDNGKVEMSTSFQNLERRTDSKC